MDPQPSKTVPQAAPRSAQVFATQSDDPHWLAIPPPPQTWPSGQDPHASVFPHPSPVGPQVAPRVWQVTGTQPDDELPLPPLPPFPPTKTGTLSHEARTASRMKSPSRPRMRRSQLIPHFYAPSGGIARAEGAPRRRRRLRSGSSIHVKAAIERTIAPIRKATTWRRRTPRASPPKPMTMNQ